MKERGVGDTRQGLTDANGNYAPQIQQALDYLASLQDYGKAEPIGEGQRGFKEGIVRRNCNYACFLGITHQSFARIDLTYEENGSTREYTFLLNGSEISPPRGDHFSVHEAMKIYRAVCPVEESSSTQA